MAYNYLRYVWSLAKIHEKDHLCKQFSFKQEAKNVSDSSARRTCLLMQLTLFFLQRGQVRTLSEVYFFFRMSYFLNVCFRSRSIEKGFFECLCHRFLKHIFFLPCNWTKFFRTLSGVCMCAAFSMYSVLIYNVADTLQT